MKYPNRRDLLSGALAAAPLLVWPRRAPAIVSRTAKRPRITSGIMSGDISPKGAVIWSRADRDSRMRIECATDAKFENIVARAQAEALRASDFTAKIGVTGLPPGQTIHYRVVFENLRSTKARSEPMLGQFRTPSVDGTAPVRFAWSGDTCGQGYGIHKTDGMAIHAKIAAHDPDLFIHCGDLIYADGPIRPIRRIRGGRKWHNLMLPGIDKVCETQAEFRTKFRYNLLDTHFRALNAQVPMVVTWDDHETKNNWWPGRVLDEDDRYEQVKSCDLLAARGKRAFFEYSPIAAPRYTPHRIYRHLPYGPLLDMFVLDARSFRGPNTRNKQTEAGPETAFFGDAQIDWLLDCLTRSKATWKMVVADQPLSLLIGSGTRDFEGVGNGYPGQPRGREIEIARLLKSIKDANVKNVVWITADVHYAAAFHYQPEQAGFKDFNPFWEFIAGPLNAGTFGPNRIDSTFGCVPVYVSEPEGAPKGRPPLDGAQYFGLGNVDPKSKILTIELRNMADKLLYTKRLIPA